MNEKIVTKKRIAIIIGVIVLVGVLTFLGLKLASGNWKLERSSPDTTSQPTDYKGLVDKGVSSEAKGDTDAALKSYEDARKLCAEDDLMCKNNMDAKIDMMKASQKQGSPNKKSPEAKDVIIYQQ